MYVYCAAGSMVGISAEESDLGSLLWETAEWNVSVMAPAPVQLPDNRIMITAGYGAGSMILQLSKGNGDFSITPVMTIPRSRFACEQHTPIFYKDHLFTILPSDGGALKKQAVCMDLNGNLVWNSGKKKRFGIGPFLIGDNKMFILSDDGELTMIEADTGEYKELAHSKVLQGHDAWGPMALVEGRLILRDFDKMICIDLREGTE
jgi:outer membrane protein assembly factor BamB